MSDKLSREKAIVVPDDWQECELLRQTFRVIGEDLKPLTSCLMPAEARSKVEDFKGFVEAVLRKEGDRNAG